MAPPRARGIADDARSEASSTKEKPATSTPSVVAPKARRNGNNATSVGSSLKEAVSATPGVGAASTTAVTNGANGLDGSNGIPWNSLDTFVLHAYRQAYRINCPSAFRSNLNQAILCNPGIGRYSPTMARPRDRRRVGKDHLATAVRKNFNGLGINESEVVVDFLYKARWQDNSFRLRFTPQKTR